MKRICLVCLLALFLGGAAWNGRAEDVPPKLEIISAVYGSGPEAVDLTQKVRKEVKAGTWLSFHNDPRFTGKTFKDAKADKNIRIVYKENGEKKEVLAKHNRRITLGRLAKKYQFGTPEWIAYHIDKSGAAEVMSVHGNPIQGFFTLPCPKCKGQKTVRYCEFEENPMQCGKCGFVFSEETLPTTGFDMFEGMKREYHQTADGKKIPWKPMLRNAKAQYLLIKVRRTGKKDPKIAKQCLDAMIAYGGYYKKYYVNGRGRKIHRPGYPYGCNWGRLCHFGDYMNPSGWCDIYKEIKKSGLKITPEEHAAYRSLLENVISEVTFPYIRQARGMGNPMGGAFGDCIYVGRTFPDARIIDYYTPDKEGNPRIMSGTDLVYEIFQGRNGLENLVSTYYYSDGLMHEPSVSYQRMLSGGISGVLNRRLEGFQPPAGYDPEKRGYKPFNSKGLVGRPEYKRLLSRHLDVSFQNGEAIPFGDSASGLNNMNPPLKSDLYHSWGIAALRQGTTAAAMNWPDLSQAGHAHNDMLNLLYWGNGLLMLTTTEYPANEPAAPIQYWRSGTGAHNTVMVDGKNHERARGNPGAWGVTDHLQIAQGYSEKSHPGAILRRTAFLVNSRPDSPPYLVDFYSVDGGMESHDYFLQSRARPENRKETLQVLSPRMYPTRKASLAEVFANAEKKNVYPFIRNPKSGAFNGNAELLWKIPFHRRNTVFLHGLLVPDAGKNTLYTGDAPGITDTVRDPKDRTVSKVVWRHEKPSKGKMKSCFIAAFEYANREVELNIKDVKRLQVTGNPASHAAEVVHGNGKDILLLSDASGKMSVRTSSGEIAFDGIAALLSLNKNGRLVKVTTTGCRSLDMDGKRISGGSYFTGRLAGLPTGLSKWLSEEKDAVVTVSAAIPSEAVGEMLLVKHKCGTVSYKITGVKPLSGKTELQLDRSARKMIAPVIVSPDRRKLSVQSGGAAYMEGCNIVADGRMHRIKKLVISRKFSGKTLVDAEAELETPLAKSGPQRVPVTEFSADDPFVIMTSKTIEFK